MVFEAIRPVKGASLQFLLKICILCDFYNQAKESKHAKQNGKEYYFLLFLCVVLYIW